jgi:cellulose biosynthesis protein BcsQ
VRLGEAPSHGLPISRYDPTCAGSDAYFDLAKEIVTRAPAGDQAFGRGNDGQTT